jgi:hypothetical protein
MLCNTYKGSPLLDQLSKLTSDLDSSSSELVVLRYTPVDATLSEQIISSLEKVNSTISDARAIRRANLPSADEESKMESEFVTFSQQLTTLRRACAKELAELSTGSFPDFGGRFARSNLVLFLTALLPLLSLAALFLLRVLKAVISNA